MHKADGVEGGVLVDGGLRVPVVRFVEPPVAELLAVELLADVPFLVDSQLVAELVAR